MKIIVYYYLIILDNNINTIKKIYINEKYTYNLYKI